MPERASLTPPGYELEDKISSRNFSGNKGRLSLRGRTAASKSTSNYTWGVDVIFEGAKKIVNHNCLLFKRLKSITFLV